MHRITLLLLLLSTVVRGAAPVPDDHWFLGTISDQPSVLLHQVSLTLANGGTSERVDTTVVFRRSLKGKDDVLLEIREASVFDCDREGNPLTWRFDHEENGATTTATGSITRGRIVGTLFRLGRSTAVDLAMPADGKLVSDQASQGLMVHTGLKPGDSLVFRSLALVSNRVLVVTCTATFKKAERSGTARRFEVVSDLVPTPMSVLIGSKGQLLGTTMDLGITMLELAPCDGPVALKGADLPPTGLVKAAGPAPTQGEENHFRLPAGATVPEDSFQRLAGGVVSTRSNALPVPLPGDELKQLLAVEPNLELDDPELRKWVGDLVGERKDPAAVAELLRLAVRSHITKRDLSQADGTALETFRNRTGDCSEHAVLLCAALRIAGIPARVDVGLIYAVDYGGWVGHAWTSAYCGDRWTHLDSSYPGIARSCYLRLGSNTGGPATLPQAQLATVLGGLRKGLVTTLP